MAPPPKVSKDELVRTLEAWRGNVTQAARDLGITKKALYDRLKRLPQVNLWAVRHTTIEPGNKPATTIDFGVRIVPNTNEPCGPENESGYLVPQEPAPIFGGVVDTGESVMVAHGGRGRIKSPTLTPNLIDMIQEGRLRLQGITRVETSNDALVRQMISEEWQGWLERRIAKHETNGGHK